MSAFLLAEFQLLSITRQETRDSFGLRPKLPITLILREKQQHLFSILLERIVILVIILLCPEITVGFALFKNLKQIIAIVHTAFVEGIIVVWFF